jgi:DNA ligase (NAD+)
MSLMTARIAELRNLILKAKQAYYFGAEPIITDAQYDALEEELASLNPDDDVLKLVGAPVPPDAILTKAEHRIHMGSQSKVNTVEEFHAWYEKHAEGGVIHASLKADGASAAAYYDQGRLAQCISRGDGIIGEDITANAVRFRGLPAYVECPLHGPFTGAVRFEVILTVEDWAKIDPSMAKNPRNLGNGIMGRKNGHQAEMLCCQAFSIDESRGGEPVVFGTETAKTDRIIELGFAHVRYEVCSEPAQAVAFFDLITRTRDDLPFWIDGVVMKIDDISRQESLGVVSGRPKGQIAWKFESVGAETRINSYSVTGGHTGAMVPNAQLEPVDIGGTTVSNVLLNNWEEIERLDVAVGDTVYVIKANDIIPKVIEVRHRPDDRTPIPEPTECPFCGSGTARRVNTGGDVGAVTVCVNGECPAKSIGKVKRWIKSLDILGIGDSVLESMVEQLDLEDASDLYTLHKWRGELSAMIINTDKGIRLGDKRADSIIAAIDGARDLSLTQFLGSLGIDRLGKRRAEIMIKNAGGELNTLAAWRDGRLRDPAVAEAAGAPSLGAVIQDEIDAKSDLIEALLANGVTVTDVSAEDLAPSDSKTVCITGKLPSGKRKNDYKDPLAAAGYELVDKVTKDLDFLVLADPDSTSAKAKKARSYGTALISEEQMNEMIEETPA